MDESSGESISSCVSSIVSNDLSPVTPVKTVTSKHETASYIEDDFVYDSGTSSPVPNIILLAPPSDPVSPLKGILKKSDSVTPTRSIAERSTHYNTICNSGQKRPVPELCDAANIYNGRYLSKFNRSLNNEFNLSLEACVECEKFKRCEHHMSGNDSKRPCNAKTFPRTPNIKCLPNENLDKENVMSSNTNSSSTNNVAITSNQNGGTSKSEETSSGFSSETESMELSGKFQGGNGSYMNQYGITPLSRLTNEMQINDYGTSCSKKYSSPMINQSLNRSRSFLGTPKNNVSKSRLFSRKSRSEVAVIKQLQSDYQYGRRNVLSAYKDLLPSPLK